MSYQVALDAFHGPLDLLLYLVKRNEVEILDIPENTVKTRMFYARKRLATLVAAEGIDRAAA